MYLEKIYSEKPRFWQFHISFWGIACVILFLSGLSQSMGLAMAGSRNLLYACLGFCSCLLFLPLWETVAKAAVKFKVIILLLFAYILGTVCSLLVNHAMLLVFPLPKGVSHNLFLFGGALNFSLVVLVWCGFYLFLKQGLTFEQGDEEQKAAEAITSISKMTGFPEFIALERLGKISLLPVKKMSLVKASGDYVEFTCDGETYLKRETLTNIEKILDPKLFQRVHRSAIINLTDIEEMEAKGRGDYMIKLVSGEQVSCSRTYMAALKSRVDIAI